MALQGTSPEGLMFVLSSLEATLQNEDIIVVGQGGGGGRRRKRGSKRRGRRVKGEIRVHKSENITCIQIRIYGGQTINEKHVSSTRSTYKGATISSDYYFPFFLRSYEQREI